MPAVVPTCPTYGGSKVDRRLAVSHCNRPSGLISCKYDDACRVIVGVGNFAYIQRLAAAYDRRSQTGSLRLIARKVGWWTLGRSRRHAEATDSDCDIRLCVHTRIRPVELCFLGSTLRRASAAEIRISRSLQRGEGEFRELVDDTVCVYTLVHQLCEKTVLFTCSEAVQMTSTL